MNPVTEPDPDFDAEEWLELWDAHEAEMKQASIINQELTLHS